MFGGGLGLTQSVALASGFISSTHIYTLVLALHQTLAVAPAVALGAAGQEQDSWVLTTYLDGVEVSSLSTTLPDQLLRQVITNGSSSGSGNGSSSGDPSLQSTYALLGDSSSSSSGSPPAELAYRELTLYR